MLRFGIDDLRACRATGRAVAAFSIYNAEQVVAVLKGAERAGQGVILQAGSSAFAYLGRELLAGMTLTAAREAVCAVGVHLDHSRDLEEVAWCLEAGYTSVMFDGSHLDFDANVEATAEAVRIAQRSGAWVEGELVGTAGDEERSTEAVATAMTDPAMAAEFVRRTGVDALAVSVGNVHGHSNSGNRLDFSRLRQIAGVVGRPLVLHGASGLLSADLRTAVDLGVAKINVNTELRRAFLAALPVKPCESDSLPDALAPTIDAMTRTVATLVSSLDVGAPGSESDYKEVTDSEQHSIFHWLGKDGSSDGSPSGAPRVQPYGL